MNFLDLSGPFDLIRMLVELSLVSYIVYKVIQLVRETRAMQLVKGLLFILILSKLSEIIGRRPSLPAPGNHSAFRFRNDSALSARAQKGS